LLDKYKRRTRLFLIEVLNMQLELFCMCRCWLTNWCV